MNIVPNKRKVITIDGPSGSGKTTLAKMLAQKLGYLHLNTGIIYRAVAYLATSKDLNINDPDQIVSVLNDNKLEIKSSILGDSEVYLNGVVLGSELRTPSISEATSKISALPLVREALTKIQREAYGKNNIVAEGRDMGTVIFPDADLKFFIHVDEESRISRRLKQLKEEREEKGGKIPPNELNLLKEQMKIEIAERDKRDIERLVAPLRPAPDAIVIDNSSQTLTESLENMYHHALQRGLL